MASMTPFENAAVAQVFDACPPALCRKVLALRELIFKTAAATDGVGPLEETLKWGEPAYLTSHSKSGSTIRIGWKKANPSRYAMYFNCQTNLIEAFSLLFPGEFRFEGRRALVFDEFDAVPSDSLAFCIIRSEAARDDVWILKPGQRLLLHGEVGLDVLVRRGGALVAKPQRDHADVHARLQQMHCCRVTQGVRRDRPAGQAGHRSRNSLHGQRQPLRHIGSSHRLGAAVGQQR